MTRYRYRFIVPRSSLVVLGVPSPLNRDDDLVVDASPGLGKWVVADATP